MLKKGDVVKINATKEDLKNCGINDLSIHFILDDNIGIVYNESKIEPEVRTALGVWSIPIKYLEATGDREAD